MSKDGPLDPGVGEEESGRQSRTAAKTHRGGGKTKENNSHDVRDVAPNTNTKKVLRKHPSPTEAQNCFGLSYVR